MNDNELHSADYTRSLPPPLKNDPTMTALARVIAEQLQGTVRQIGKNIIYARIDELDEQTLDVLAYDLHVDWYDYSYPIEVKRQTIRDSVRVHRRLGTKYAVETALGAVFPGTRVQEWFEYGGEPYMFKVIIGATESGVSADRQAAVLERVRFYKNLRSHLEAISYQIEKKAAVFTAAVHSVGVPAGSLPLSCRGHRGNGAHQGRSGPHRRRARGHLPACLPEDGGRLARVMRRLYSANRET